MPKLKLPNIDDVVAIDIHTHAEEPCGMHGDDGYDDFQAQMADYFKSPHKHPPTVPETAAYYRSKNIAAVIFPVDAERETGFRRYKNEEMLEIASDHLDVLIPFVSIDPHKGKLGVREARKLIEEYGVRGFKFHPTMQGFYANDRMAYPLYEEINNGGAIALFHTGQTGVGSGMPGGMGMRLKYSNPMYMDDVAADFPDLKIILAHPSFPWQEEALSVATHKPNVYIDLSGWSPKYFPPILVRYINSILQDKMLFGSDWPVITPDRWLADFAKLDIRDEIRPKVLKANARKISGDLKRVLTTSAHGPRADVGASARSVHACEIAGQNCPALAECLDTLVDQADLLGEYSSQLVARREGRIVVPHTRQQLLDRFERHPGGTKHLDPTHGFLFRQAVVAIAGVGPQRRKQPFALVIAQHSDADPRPPGEFANFHLKTS